ncbi:hypothetical protein ILYODFUR_012216 [Ilyodon furcidens]|uniref:Uncharacterized protein n=1 Tax=Ilyodon furcidens TaxID=33524 RepID=A0ABV0T8P5_9TELE
MPISSPTLCPVHSSLPGTCQPKEGTNLFSGSPACKTPATPVHPPISHTPPGRKPKGTITTSPVKLSLCDIIAFP